MANPKRRNNPPNKSNGENLERDQIVQIKRKDRKRNGRDEKDTFGAVKKIGLSCLALVTVVVGIAVYRTFLIKPFELETFPDSVPDFSDDTRTTAELLRLIVANAKDVIRFEKELADFAGTRELDKFLGEHIRPIQDKLTSLKSQTAGYEKMEHIPGGPTSFIESSTQELIHMEENMGSLYDKVAKIIVEERKKIGYFRESVNDVRFKARHVMDLMVHPSLTENGVYLIPLTGSMDGEAFELLKHISSEKIVDVLAKLEELFGKIPEHFGEISPELDHLMYEKDTFLEENSQIIMLTAPLHVQLGKNIDKLQDELGVYAIERRKAILALRSTIENGIRTLSVRIQNLRYEYAKIPV